MSNVKFRVKGSAEPTKEVFFGLKEAGDGGIVLSAYSASGGVLKDILAITPNGVLRRYGFAQVDGIQTDDEGRIVLADE